jgi:hypothetical protein
MLSPLIRAGLVLLAVSGAAQAQYKELWSTIDNQTGKDQVLIITDATATVGNIFVKPEGSDKYATLKRRGDSAQIPTGRSQVYFDTSMGTVAIWFKVGEAEFNVGFNRLGTVATKICVQEKFGQDLMPFTLRSAGFMRTNGPTWLTLESSR